MARDSSGTQNQPHYSATGAPSDAADLTEVSDYAAAVGNRKRGTDSQRTALGGADIWAGLRFFCTDTKIEWLTLDGSAWKAWESDWITYTPTYANLTVGNGTSSVRYKYADGRIIVEGIFTLGSTSSVGTAPTFTHPVTASSVSGTNWMPIGKATYLLPGTAAFDGDVLVTSTTVGNFQVKNVAATFPSYSSVTAANPFTWGTGHSILWTYSYGPA